MTFGPLVSADWLKANLGAPDLKVLDGTWHMPGEPEGRDFYLSGHIPGAIFFNIDEVSDKSNPLPHMLPSPQQFEAAAGAMGLTEKDRIVVYDDRGVFTAARVWWTFRVMGHEKIAVLDGGFPAWRAAGGAVETEVPLPPAKIYTASPKPQLAASAADVRAALVAPGVCVVDARSAGRFKGEAPEPRAGLRQGHMPGACSLPFTDLHTAAAGLKSPEEIVNAFREAGADLSGRVITSCGSGVTAAVLSLALEVIGCRNHAVYDGSWTEWGDERNDNAAFPVVR